MLSDPIAALATAPGRSAIAVVRLSGEGALDIAARVVQGFRPSPPREARLATFRDPTGEAIDRGLYIVFSAPRSYTGDDLVEGLFVGLDAWQWHLLRLDRSPERPDHA